MRIKKWRTSFARSLFRVDAKFRADRKSRSHIARTFDIHGSWIKFSGDRSCPYATMRATRRPTICLDNDLTIWRPWLGQRHGLVIPCSLLFGSRFSRLIRRAPASSLARIAGFAATVATLFSCTTVMEIRERATPDCSVRSWRGQFVASDHVLLRSPPRSGHSHRHSFMGF